MRGYNNDLCTRKRKTFQTMEQQKRDKTLGNKQSQTTNERSASQTLKQREVELIAELKALRLQGAQMRRDLFRISQNDALNRGLMEQKNAICAIMLIDQHYNMKKKNRRDTPPGTQVTFTISRDPLSEDHRPSFDCRVSIRIRGMEGEQWQSDTWSAPTKVEAKELAANHLLSMLSSELDFAMPNGGWIKDLVAEGIEPNPGPVTQNRGRTFRGSGNSNFSLDTTQPQDFNTLYFFTESGSGGQSVSITIIKTSGAQVLNIGPNARLGPVTFPGGESVNITMEQEPPNASITWRVHQFWGRQQSDPVTISQTVATVVTNSVDARLVNQPIQTIVGNVELDVNVTNSSIPISIDSGDGFNVTVINDVPLTTTISSESQPLWVTSINPGPQAEADSSVSHTDILKDGDVEANPGPQANIEEIEDPFSSMVVSDEARRTVKGSTDVISLELTSPEILALLEPQPQSFEQASPVEELDRQSYKIDHLSKLARMEGRIGEYFTYACYILEIPVTNYYSKLDNEILEAEAEYTKVGDKPKSQPKPQTVMQQPAPIQQRKERKTEVNIDPAEQRRAVLKRIGSKFMGENRHKIVGWLEHTKPKRKFCEIVATELFGVNWIECACWDQYHLAVFSYLNNIPKSTQIIQLLTFDSQHPKYMLLDNHRADLEAAKLHGKTMHAYNGNPLQHFMKQVDELDGWRKAFTGPVRSLPRYTGIEAQAIVTNVAGHVNFNQSDLFSQDRLRGNVISQANEFLANQATTLPSTNLIPRRFWTPTDGPDNFSEDPYGARVSEVNIAEYYSDPIKATTLSANISQQTLNGITSAWRRDNTTLSGFNMKDVADINTVLPQKGLSLEEMLLRLELLHGVLSLNTRWQAIPASAWCVVNPSFRPNRFNPVIGVNNSPVPGENCGGNDPVYPWGGDKGRVAFHLTPESVPLNEREAVVFMPPALLQASQDGIEAIALFVMSLTEWPFCLYTYSQNGVFHVNEAVSNPTNVEFIPTETWTRIPGRKLLHVILPRKIATANPTSIGEAVGSVMVRPATGPLASVNSPANSTLDVNAVGVPTVYYRLTDYLYTWCLQWDITTIKNYIGRLGVMVGVREMAYVVREIRINLCQQIPPMYLREIGGGNQIPVFPQNAAQEAWLNEMHIMCYSNHTEVGEAPALEGVRKFPIQAPISADYRIFETNLAVWNMVALGLATADNLRSEGLTLVPAHLGDARSHFWDRLEVIPMTTSWFTFYFLSGMTARCWEEGYTQVQNRWIQSRVRNTFCTSQANGTLVPAVYDTFLRKIMEYTYERSPSVAITSVSGREVEVSHFGRWLPALKYAKTYGYVYNTAQVNSRALAISSFIPVLLPDVWIQYPAKNLIKSMASFPPPAGIDGLQGYNDTKVKGVFTHRNNEVGYTGPYIEGDLRAVYALNKGPDPIDEVKWNTRLWFTSPLYIPGNYSGNAPEEIFPFINDPAVINPTVRPAARNIFTFENEGYAFGLPSMNTMCFPDMSVSGQRIIPYLTAAPAQIYVQAENRANRVGVSVWALGEVYLEPDIQAYESSGVEDCFADFVAGDECLSFLESAPAVNTEVSPEELASRAVDVTKSTDLANQSTTTAQPAPTVTSPLL